jgi:TolA-binding protein
VDNKKAALETYQKVLARYPASKEAAQAIYLSGFVHYAMEEWEPALTCFNTLIGRYPDSKQAEMVRAVEIPAARAALAAQRESGKK